MFTNMEVWNRVRHRVLVEWVSRRQAAREAGLNYRTVCRILEHAAPPGYCRGKPRERPKLGPFLARIEQVLAEDRDAPRKQRHTAARLLERLRAEGFTGGYSTVKEAVARLRHKQREVFVPLEHAPGEAQVDFGHALFRRGGRLVKLPFFVMSLPYSNALYVQVFARECMEAFAEGHRRAFAYYGGVARRITYDNTTLAVADIIGRARRLTAGFLRLQSHYLFDHHFCRPARGNEKGVVEGGVRWARSHLLVPVPEIGDDLGPLNAELEQRCRDDLRRTLRGRSANKAELLAQERAAFLPLPAAEFDTARTAAAQASSLSLVRFDGNDYSVPTAYAHQAVTVRGGVERVTIACGGATVAEHRRLWEREQTAFEPRHYLALLERKPGALDHARPLAGWELPPVFAELRARLEEERERDGTREYIRVLRLLESHAPAEVAAAVAKTLRVGAPSRDAVSGWLMRFSESAPAPLGPAGRARLPALTVPLPDLAAYAALWSGGGASQTTKQMYICSETVAAAPEGERRPATHACAGLAPPGPSAASAAGGAP